MPIEHLLTCSSVSPNDCFVPACKKPRGHELNEEKNLFNDLLKRHRSRSEHCISVLKGRFPFFKSVEFSLTEDESSMKKHLDCVNVCSVLHNHLLTQNDDGTKVFCENDGCASDVDANDEWNHPISNSQTNHTRRRQLTRHFAENFF